MHKITTYTKLMIILSAFFLLTACGQKGDLYLPDGSSFIEWII